MDIVPVTAATRDSPKLTGTNKLSRIKSPLAPWIVSKVQITHRAYFFILSQSDLFDAPVSWIVLLSFHQLRTTGTSTYYFQ